MMSKINQTDIDRLIELVGGRGNIATVSHCITRLRFVLNQPANARPKEIEQLPMVKGCFTNAGQFQVVIGTNVGDYYQALIASTGQAQVDKEQVKKAARQNMKWHEQLISHFAEIFFPLLPALISGGLILGFRNVIGDLPMSNGQTLAQMYPSLQTIYDFLWLIGEAIFFYLPVGICWSAVKKMGGTPILGIVLGVTLVSPQLMNAYLLGQQLPEVWDFGMFSIAKVGYQAQVIPALLAGLALGVIETRLKRIVPDYLYLVVVPVCSLILAVFLAHALIGPFGRMIGDGVAFAVRHLMTGSFAPIGAALFGFLYAPLVITGVHQTTLAIDLQMIQSMGGTPVWPLIALSNIAQGSAVIGIIISSRKHNEREISVPAAKMLAMVLHGMQGTPYIYQGEEIGMTNPHFTRITDYRDVESLNMFAELRNDGRDADELLAILASKSRDNSRTPMQWSNGDNAGFTAGEPWIGLGDNYQQINVEAALADDSSVFYTYQKLIALRKQEAILTWGNYQDLLPNSPVLWCYRREWKGQTLLVIANLSREIQPWQPGQMRGNWQLVMHNYEEASPQPCAMTLRPFEAVWWLQK